VPKPLLTVAGVPLVGHALAHAMASGCRSAVVVVGHEAGRVKAAVEALGSGLEIRFVTSPDPASPNGISLLAAEAEAHGPFFLQMVDHLFAGIVLPKLASALTTGEGGRVLVDKAPDGLDLSDATKVSLDGDRVIAIGKGLDTWDAIDAGCFVLTDAVFDALRSVPESEPKTVSSGMRRLAALGLLGAVDLEGVAWADVDTPRDRAQAERVLADRTPA
jgi:choline kinase